MIIAVCGKSAAGKTSIANLLCMNMKLPIAISSTTRPPRSGEKEANTYNFETKEQFFSEEKIFQDYIVDKDWHYGYSKDLIDKKLEIGEDFIMVLSPKGIKELKAQYPNESYTILLYSEDKDRIIRSITRSEDVDCKEICRRFLADEEDFKDLEKYADLKINTSVNTQIDVIEIIKGLIFERA